MCSKQIDGLIMFFFISELYMNFSLIIVNYLIFLYRNDRQKYANTCKTVPKKNNKEKSN